MAEHLNQPTPDHSDDAMYWMGKPIPPEARAHAMTHALEIGLDTVHAHACIEAMAEKLQHDDPYGAQRAAMRYVDITGWYRLLAALLSATMQIAQRKEGTNA